MMRKLSVTVLQNSRHFSEEPQDGFGELVERRVVAIVGYPFVHNAPKALNWIQVRRVWW